MMYLYFAVKYKSIPAVNYNISVYSAGCKLAFSL